MTTGGWILMIVSVGAVTGFFAWCLHKVLSNPCETDRLKAETNIRPVDRND